MTILAPFGKPEGSPHQWRPVMNTSELAKQALGTSGSGFTAGEPIELRRRGALTSSDADSPNA